MDPTIVALIAAAIGAGGAVLAQIVGGIFSGRHETRRLRFEQDRAKRAEALELSGRFLDIKRETYASFLHATREARDFLCLAELELHPWQGDEVSGSWDGKWDEMHENLRRIHSDLRLLSPDVADDGYKLLHYLDEWEKYVRTDNSAHTSRVGGLLDLMDVCEVRMRTDLGLPPKRTNIENTSG